MPPISPELRTVFEGLADVLIAEGHGKPPASAIGIGRELLDRTLGTLPSFSRPLLGILEEAIDEDPESFARLLHSSRPTDFRVLATVTVGAYYLSPEVRRLIGYPGQVPAPLSIAGTPDYLTDGMLERVYERHPGYRLA